MSVACGAVGSQLHVIGLGNDQKLYHTIRNSDATWQDFFGLVEGQVSGGPDAFYAVGCAGVGDVLEVVGLGDDHQLYHTLRNADGSWQNFFGLVEGQVSGGPAGFAFAQCGATGTDLQLVAGGYVVT
jgi:hypothetical protein